MNAAGRKGYNPGAGASRGRAVPRTLRELRTSLGLSLRDLEARSGVSRATVSQIERGRLVATTGEADLIAEGLGLGAGSLATRTTLIYDEVPA